MTQTAHREIRRLDNFRGDFDALSNLLERSWSENTESSLRYTPAFLRSAFEYPGAEAALAPTLYERGLPVAFVAGFPRRARHAGLDLRLLLNTFLTVAPEHKGKATGAAMWTEFVKRARAAGYDGTINFCAEGSPSNGVVAACGSRLGLNTRRVFTVSYLLRLLRPAPLAPREAPDDTDVQLLVDLAGELPLRTAFARLWTFEEADWNCRRRDGAVCCALRAGPRRGLLTGCIVEVHGTPPSKTLLLDDILWGDLEAEERRQLLSKVLTLAAGQGVQMVSAPLMGYADTAPLQAAGFRKSRRLMHAYLTEWSGAELPAAVPSFYMDVF